MFYAKNEAADICFVMKPKTGRISLFNVAIERESQPHYF